MNWIIGIVLLVALASGAAALEARAGNDQHVPWSSWMVRTQLALAH